MTTQKAPYLFVIDTADYAGNFERELCAYITGHVGECEVGADAAAKFKVATKLKPLSGVIFEQDDHGCSRPVSIYPTPGWFNNGVGGYFKDTPANQAKALKAYQTYAKREWGNSLYHKYLKDWKRSSVMREKLAQLGHTEAKLQAACRCEETRLKLALALKKPYKCPAYQSVAISFKKKPTDAQLQLMKRRAYEFADLPERISKIIGFRLVEQANKVKRTVTNL